MALNVLLLKLIEIEQSVGHESHLAVRHRIIDAQEYILAIQQGLAAQARMSRVAADFELRHEDRVG